MEIDGFYYDPVRRRYFRIQNDHQMPPASCAYTRDALRFKTRENERLRLLIDHADDSAAAAVAASKSPGVASILPLKRRQRFLDDIGLGVDVSTLTARRQFSLVGERSILRVLDERRAASTPKTPTTVCRPMQDELDVRLDRCRYIGASPAGDNILGCWSVSQSPWGTRIMCLNVQADGKRASERSPYGLTVRPTDNFICTLDRNVVDLCPAKMDSAVTCVLYATLPPAQRGSHVFLQPVPEMSDICDQVPKILGLLCIL
uniref:Uncharacterized protein n=2 Tax=Romanomermis culicivorax TaxID=13658 RepID=A0A915JL37_ROMCU